MSDDAITTQLLREVDGLSSMVAYQAQEIARLTERCDAYKEALGFLSRTLADARQQIEHFREHGWLPDGATDRDFGTATLELIESARKLAQWRGEDVDYYAARDDLRNKLAALATLQDKTP